jgi:hypothetical protein
VEREKETHLPSASSFSGGFAPDEDMMVKTKRVLSMVCGSHQVISHAIVFPTPIIPSQSPDILPRAQLLSLLRVSLSFPFSLVTDGGMKKPGSSSSPECHSLHPETTNVSSHLGPSLIYPSHLRSMGHEEEYLADFSCPNIPQIPAHPGLVCLSNFSGLSHILLSVTTRH